MIFQIFFSKGNKFVPKRCFCIDMIRNFKWSRISRVGIPSLRKIFIKTIPSTDMDHSRLLIIGAGTSGITAAAKLLEHGFTDFKILEAENRVGGRINTTLFDDFPVELGAEWIHGESNNVVYELASKNGLANTDPVMTNFIYSNFYDSSGHQINKDLTIALNKACYEIMNTIEKDLNYEMLKESVGTYFELEYQKVIDKLQKNLNIDIAVSEKFLKTFELWQNSIDGSHSWYETSLRNHLEYWECDGNLLTEWKNHRYDTLFSLLTKKIPDPKEQLPVYSRIMLNKEVIKINWNKECKPNLPNVIVECLDGSLYSSDAVLITCSLGVLKERVSDMFFPSLPFDKLNCIKNLGIGTVDKIFVKFDHCWWENECFGYNFLWSDEERKNDSSGWLNGVIGFHPIFSEWPILRGWVTAEAAQHMETLSQEDILKGLNYLFHKFLGPSLNVPPAKSCIVSQWYKNPHFRGSYSCRLLKSEEANVWASQLAESICNTEGRPVLFFGGEATHDHYFSTVHGAVESGHREAEKLLQTLINEVQSHKYFEVAIVGAGISGLAAAKTLLENGVSNIVILEAQSEPGGRIRSLQVEDYSLELGAQWIHGDKNEVFSICQDNDLVTDECSSEGEGLYFRESGEQIDESIIRDVDDIVKTILENCETYVLSKEKISRSIGEELLIKFNEYLESCSQDTEEVKKVKKELFGWHMMFLVIDNSCSDLFNLSAKYWGLFKFCGGSDYINFRNGYSSLINTIVNGLPEKVLRCNSSVQRIDWFEEMNITEQNDFSNYSAKITTKDGTTLSCQYVIVTTSLGYLKRNYKTMFSPPLPNYLSEAVEFLDFGILNKIFLIYERPWWDPQVKGFQLVWSNEVADESKRHWGRYLTGFDVILKNKPVLLGWLGGVGAITVEQLPEEEIGRQATEILRKFIRNREIPLPKKVIRTQWWSNEYIRGAYCHITVQCAESEICCSNLAQPVYSTVHTKSETFLKPTILLAGESAHKNHFSTVHGAYESGQSQARVILKHIQSRDARSKCRDGRSLMQYIQVLIILEIFSWLCPAAKNMKIGPAVIELKKEGNFSLDCKIVVMAKSVNDLIVSKKGSFRMWIKSVK